MLQSLNDLQYDGYGFDAHMSVERIVIEDSFLG